MAVGESLIVSAIKGLLELPLKEGWKALSRKEKVIKVKKMIGLTTPDNKATFEHIYAYTLVEFGVDKVEPILEFFRHPHIKKAFLRSFEENNPSFLLREADFFIKWEEIGIKLRELGLNPRLEFARFTLLFNNIVKHTRTPYEILQANIQEDMQKDIHRILEMIKKLGFDGIRAKNLEQIQGTLVERAIEWFKTLGYSISSEIIRQDGCSELLITIPARRRVDRVLVRCVEHQAELADMMDLKKAVEERRTDEGWLIAARRKSQGACEKAETEKNLYCYTFDELLDEHADFRRYFDWLKKEVETRKIDKMYISLACKRDIFDQDKKEKIGEERYDKKKGWIEGYIDRWLQDSSKEHISILGEFGTGKTWFTLHYAYNAMKKYLEAKEKSLERPRLPVVIQLRDYAKVLGSESLFSDFFFRKHEIPLPGYSAFEYLNRIGKLLLIFDGFDEMADKLDRQKMINNFWELARVVVPGAKAILTCRNEHFPSAKEGRALLSAELKASVMNLTGEPPQFEVLMLEPFDDEQIEKALKNRTDDNRTVEYIMKHPLLLDMARRPVLMEYILECIPEIESGKPIDLARIYLYALQKN